MSTLKHEPATSDPGEQTYTVKVSVPREVIEREVIVELMALRDERVLRTLSEEQRQQLGENPVGRVAHLTTVQFAQLGSFTNGFFCKGTPGITKGVICKGLATPT